jgi:hypothetical protein
MVAGEAEIASIIAIRPPSMRLAISISPSRVSSSTVPISRMYMRTGSVVRPNSLSTVDRAASASSSASSTVAAVGRGVVQQQHLGVGRLLVHRHAQVVEHRDHDFQRLGVHQLFGQVVGDFAVRQVAARLAQRDQRLQALAALGHFLFGQDGLVQAEFLHQGAFLRLADLHAQRLDLLGDRVVSATTGSLSANSASMSDRSSSSPPACRRPAFGLRPRLAPGGLGGRFGFGGGGLGRAAGLLLGRLFGGGAPSGLLGFFLGGGLLGLGDGG